MPYPLSKKLRFSPHRGTALVVFFAAAACGPRFPAGEETNRPLDQIALESLFERGRSVEQATSTRDSWLSLSGEGPLHHVERARGGDTAVWLTFDTSKTQAIAASELAPHARRTVARHQDLLEVPVTQLKRTSDPTESTTADGLVHIRFHRHYRGFPVRDAFVEVIYQNADAESFHLREIVNRSHGSLTLSNPQQLAAEPTRWEALELNDWNVLGSRRLIYPKVKGDGGRRFTLATEFRAQRPAGNTVVTLTVADGTGAPLEAYKSRYAAEKPTLKGRVFGRGYLDATPEDKPLPLTLTLVESSDKTLKTNLDGEADLDGPTELTATLENDRISLREGGSASAAQFTSPVTSEGTEHILMPEGPTLNALNAYTSFHEINRFARRHLMESEVPFLGEQLTVRVNVDGNCNAFFDSQQVSISLFSAGDGCANTARVNDVLYHEWGHGLDDATGGITDGAFSEGLSDVVAAYYTGSSQAAPGFLLNDDQGIRMLENTSRYPDDQGEVHAEGTIIAGAFWDLRQMMIDRYGKMKGSYRAERLFFRHLLTTDSYLDSYAAVLRLNDDDGNPATPSPDHCLINRAFAGHGLAEPENCSDDPPAPVVPVEGDLYLGVHKKTPEGLILMASAEETTPAVTGCFGGRESCLPDPDDTVAFEKNKSEDGRTFFVAKAPVEVETLGKITLIAEDETGEATGARTVQFVSK